MTIVATSGSQMALHEGGVVLAASSGLQMALHDYLGRFRLAALHQLSRNWR